MTCILLPSYQRQYAISFCCLVLDRSKIKMGTVVGEEGGGLRVVVWGALHVCSILHVQNMDCLLFKRGRFQLKFISHLHLANKQNSTTHNNNNSQLE